MKKLMTFVLMILVGASLVLSSACVTKIKSGPTSLSTSQPGVAKTYADPDHPLNQYPLDVQKSCEKIAMEMIEKGIKVTYGINADGSCKVTPVSAESNQQKRGIWENHLDYDIKVEFGRADKNIPPSTFIIAAKSFKRFCYYPNVEYAWVIRTSRNKTTAVVDSGKTKLPFRGAYSEFAKEYVDCVRRTGENYG